jgi:hypothetical protein
MLIKEAPATGVSIKQKEETGMERKGEKEKRTYTYVKMILLTHDFTTQCFQLEWMEN